MNYQRKDILLSTSLTPRQIQLKKWAEQREYKAQLSVKWETSSLQQCHFFRKRIIQYKENLISGAFGDCSWEIADVAYQEGVSYAMEEYHRTFLLVNLPNSLPHFALTKASRFEKVFYRILKTARVTDIDFLFFPDILHKYILLGKREEDIRELFSSNLVQLLESKDDYYIENSGKSLLFSPHPRIAHPETCEQIIHFAAQFVENANI